jgi:hypothetical protein
MKSQQVRKTVPVVLSILTALCLTAFFSTRGLEKVSAQVLLPQKPQSGCCAAVYTHVATASNTAGDWTELDNSASNNNPNASVVVTPNRSASPRGIIDTHPIGVWYDAMAGRWAIFNQDRAAMPVGAAFNVYAGTHFLQVGSTEASALDVASSSNSKENWIYIDNPVTNNNPNAFVNVTLNWTPGGTGGVYDPHPLGVWYDASVQKWAIFNEGSMDPIPSGAAFNLLLDTSTVSGIFLHTATSANTSGNQTVLDDSAANNSAQAIVFATPNFNPAAQGGTYEAHNLGVFYQNGQWAIFNTDNAAMPVNAAFDILASFPVH